MNHCVFRRGFWGGSNTNGLKYLGAPDKRIGLTAVVSSASGFVSNQSDMLSSGKMIIFDAVR
jgi:hypothetical protein